MHAHIYGKGSRGASIVPKRRPIVNSFHRGSYGDNTATCMEF